MIFKKDAEKAFEVRSITSDEMETFILQCGRIYQGKPDWIDTENHIKTVNFAKSVCSETARLTTLAIKIQISGSARAEWLQAQIDKVYFKFRDWVEYGAAYGTIILKPNGEGIDAFIPGRFIVTSKDGNGNINGIVFLDTYTGSEKERTRYYTRMEYHRFIVVDEITQYAISNRAYVSDSGNSIGDPIDLKKTKWKDLLPELFITKENDEQLDSPMFGVLKSPQANNIDLDSPLGLPMFSEAIEEMKDLDIAYSRNALEIKDSEKIVLLDSDRLLPSGGKVNNTAAGFARSRDELGLPHYVKNVYGDGQESFYQEINPELRTEQRLTGINALLSQIGYKCGYSNGYFVFNEKTGMVTATQVESDDRRTIQLIKDWRDKLEDCLDGVIYALSIMADYYGYTPAGTYETVYDFGDITYSREEDRARWWNYVIQNKVPAWMYFVKFEGMTEEDAKAMVEEAQPKETTLFGEEE